MNHRMNQYFVVQKFKNFGTYSGTNYASYRIIGIEIIRFRCKVHLMVRGQRTVVLSTTTGQNSKSENPIGQWTHVIIMKCKSSSLIAPQLWSWYPYQESSHFIFFHSFDADPCLWEIMLHNSHAIDEHVLLKIFFVDPISLRMSLISRPIFLQNDYFESR